MRVCDVVLNSVWYDPRVRKQLTEYKNRGIDVCCVGMKCNRYDEERIKNIPCPVKITNINEKFSGRQTNPFKKIIQEKMKKKAVIDAILSFSPSIIHANDLNALIPSYQASKKLGCKLIYDSHEINAKNYWNGNLLHKVYGFYLRIIEKHICKRIDKMICVSYAAAEYFVKEYNIPMPLVVTNCALKSEQCFTGEKNSGFEVLNHGQFYDGRGYNIMVESIPLLKDIPEVKLAVRGMGRLEELLKKRAKELGDENFRFYPPVLVQELIPYASKSMVGVAITQPICLNFKLSVSNKLFEYASAGLPVIMSDIPEHRYLNEKYNFGIILEKDTPECFADAVRKLYEDKDFYETCSKNAIKLSNELNWENEFQKLISFEEKLLKK